MDTTLHVCKSGMGRTATVVKANDSEEGECIAFDLESVQIGEDGTTAPVVVAINHFSSNTSRLQLLLYHYSQCRFSRTR